MSGNIEIIRRFEHAFRAAHQATIDELSDPGLVDHDPAPGHEPTLAGFKHKVEEFKAAFPDLTEDLQDITGGGDTVATRWVLTGSQQREFMGIPAAGQAIFSGCGQAPRGGQGAGHQPPRRERDARAHVHARLPRVQSSGGRE